MDFARSSREAGTVINDWVCRATEKHIPAICPPDGPASSTRLFITGAIWFQAAWKSQFGEQKTREQEFRTLSGRKVSVRFMRAFDSYRYAEDAETTFLQLPYTGDRYAMLFALPKGDRSPVGVVEGLMASWSVAQMPLASISNWSTLVFPGSRSGSGLIWRGRCVR